MFTFKVTIVDLHINTKYTEFSTEVFYIFFKFVLKWISRWKCLQLNI